MKSRLIEIAKSQKISDIGFCSMTDYEKEAETTADAGFSRRNRAEDEEIRKMHGRQ